MIRFFIFGFFMVVALTSSPNAYGCDAGKSKTSASAEGQAQPVASVPSTNAATVASRNVRRTPSGTQKPETATETSVTTDASR